jgi:CheY-like chemotaxis protein
MGQIVLVVEDEVLIRFDISDCLRAEGFEVLEASTAQEAIKILQGAQPVAHSQSSRCQILIASGHIRSAE